MSDNEVKLGIVGAGGRGGSFQLAIEERDDTHVEAVCDLDLYDDGILEEARRELDATEAYRDYNAMLVESDIDAVVIGTPVPLHVNQSVAALERDIHVLSEVPVGVGVGECRDLVDACRNLDAKYMMAENYVYMKPNQIVKGLVEAGLFGEPYYAEGEYLHELKRLKEITKWRRVWTSGRNGIVYPTHSLGPILNWMPDDRVARVTCAGSGHHYTDDRGDKYEQEDSVVMLAETEQDRLIKIRYDSQSERPHAMDNYQLQGTDGCYESARAGHYDPEPGGFDTHKVWLDEYEDSDDSHDYTWQDLSELEAEYLPEMWRDPPAAITDVGHGGGDYFMMMDFLDSIVEDTQSPIGIHEALDMTLPGLMSLESVAQDGAWVDVPDSRNW